MRCALSKIKKRLRLLQFSIGRLEQRAQRRAPMHNIGRNCFRFACQFRVERPKPHIWHSKCPRVQQGLCAMYRLKRVRSKILQTMHEFRRHRFDGCRSGAAAARAGDRRRRSECRRAVCSCRRCCASIRFAPIGRDNGNRRLRPIAWRSERHRRGTATRRFRAKDKLGRRPCCRFGMLWHTNGRRFAASPRALRIPRKMRSKRGMLRCKLCGQHCGKMPYFAEKMALSFAFSK